MNLYKTLYLLLVSISMLLFYVPSVPIHEAGHLVCGLLSGYKFSQFRCYPFTWIKRDGRIVLTKSYNTVIIGQCLMLPPDDERKFRYILYNLGGTIANFICLVLLVLLIPYVRYNKLLLSIISGGILCHLIVVGGNLFPFKTTIPNDGMNMMTASKSPSARHGFYCMLKAGAALMGGIRFSELDLASIQIEPDCDMSNYLSIAPLTLQAAYYFDLGEYAKGIAVYESVQLDTLPRHYQNTINLDYLFYYTFYCPDYQKAEEIYNSSGLKRLSSTLHAGVTRRMAAYEFFVNGNHDKGRELLAKVKSLYSGHKLAGSAAAELELILMIEDRMNEEPAIADSVI